MRSIARVVTIAGSTLAAGACVVGMSWGGSAAVGAITTEFRIVERTGQTEANPADGVLNFAVQARVTSPGSLVGLATFSYSLTINGEPESFGTLSRDRTTSIDFTYFNGIAGPASGTSSGIPQHYGFYAGINPSFNGLINSSAATWTQSPASQDIGLILGSCTGQNLLNTPGVDTLGNGYPDTYPGTGSNATLPQPIMQQYFGAGDFIDIFRFRYTITNFTPRVLDIRFGGDTAAQTPFVNTFTRLQTSNGLWGPEFLQPSNATPSIQNLTVNVVPAPGIAAGALPALLAFGARRRR
jgi:hypothetical protein